MPRAKRKTAPSATVGQPRDLFKISDIKEDALIETVTQRAGVAKDAEVTGFIKSVIPRFSDWSANQAIRSMSTMTKEFGKPIRGVSGNSNASNGADSSGGAQAQADSGEQRRRPGRPKGSKNKATAATSNERPQASGGKRTPGRKKTKADRPRS